MFFIGGYNPSIITPAIAADGTVYVGGSQLHAFDGSSGALKWNFSQGGFVNSSPSFGTDGRICFCADRGCYALTSEGALIWNFTQASSDRRTRFGPTLSIGADGSTYVASYSWPAPLPSHIYALNTTGAVKWNTTFLMTRGLTSSAVGPDGTIYVGSARNDSSILVLWAVNGSTGVPKWNVTCTKEDAYCCVGSPAVGVDGTVYAGSCAIDGSTGALKFTFEKGGFASVAESAPVIGANGIVYVGWSDGRVWGIDGSTGAVKWNSTDLGCAAYSVAIAADGTLYVGTACSKFFALNGGTGALVPH